MYERNAVVLERYFDMMFGYNMKNNIKTNFSDYCELIDCLEKYQNISEEEETIIQEYDSIANRIREIQKLQESLNKKNNKLQEERESILQNVGENAETIQNRLNDVNNSIQSLNEEITRNAQNFVDVVAEFNEKSTVRTECGKSRRSIENEYNKKLNQTLDNYQDIDIELEHKAKQFIGIETEDIEAEIKERMKKNGEKEKVPFNAEVISKAIDLSIDIQKRETDILSNVYDKTNRLFTEIKNGSIRVNKHRKIIKDAKCKLEFLSAIKEYLIQFLDNERLTSVNGEEEHNKLMQEACKNLDEDLIQINNLYSLLLKEAVKKINKKSYSDLYNYEYLLNLEKKSEEFEAEVKKLNLPVTIINPNHWRIEGMQKIYDVFNRCVTEEYDRDLTEYMPKEETSQEEEYFEETFDDIDSDYDEQTEEQGINTEEASEEENKTEEQTEEDTKAEIDRKIDMILGFEEPVKDDSWDDDEDDIWDDDENDDNKEKQDQEDAWDDDIFESKENESEEQKDKIESDQSEDDVNFDIWGNDISNKDKKSNDNDEDDIWDDDNDNIFEDDDDDIFESDDTDDDDIWDDDDNIFEEDDNKKEPNKGKHVKENPKKVRNTNTSKKKSESKDQEDINKERLENWEEKFIRIDKKMEEKRKKKGFFDKFKR